MGSRSRSKKRADHPHKGRKPTKEELREARYAVWTEDHRCPLCGREMIDGPSLNEHHLVPKSFGGTERHVMHKVCHNKIHSIFSEAELARVYNSFDRLRGHDEMKKFIRWVAKQDPEVISKNHRPRR